MASEDYIEALVDLGFTGLEAETYVFLLRESPATGYRVAQGLARPAANVYKALEALLQKDAVLVDEGTNRVFRAVPADELLARLERSFTRRRERAGRALRDLQSGGEDDRIYQLNSPEQVLERCRSMLARARHNAVLELFPLTLEALRPDIEATAARGLQVVMKVYEPTEVPGAQVVMNQGGRKVMELFPGQLIILLIDGSEALVAFLSADCRSLHQAVWSGSVYLAFVFYAAFVSEIFFHVFLVRMEEGASTDDLRQAMGPFRSLFSLDVPGYGALLERMGVSPPPPRQPGASGSSPGNPT